MASISPKTVAEWMAEKLIARRELYQVDTVSDIQRLFGEEFVYTNNNGNLAIAKSVLKEFRLLTFESAVWVKGGRYWRQRNSFDNPKKRAEE